MGGAQSQSADCMSEDGSLPRGDELAPAAGARAAEEADDAPDYAASTSASELIRPLCNECPMHLRTLHCISFRGEIGSCGL